MKIPLTVCFFLLITFSFNVLDTKAKLFPVSMFKDELYLPNQWTSVTDCPLRYYDLGRSGVKSAANGRPAYEQEFAHMTAIGWTDENQKIEWNCEGSLISENYIVTAGHCVLWKGKAPDVARMGDLNLENDTDNKWAQQFNLEDIITHPHYSPRFRYYDIALLKLNGSIKVHETVCPACLWTNNTIRFQFLEACGYGQIGFLEEKTPKLLKVTLSPFDIENCTEYYPPNRHLRDGLKNHQICATDHSHIMETCLGNSGGPLHIKLLGNGKMNPFLIGVTSFGKSCGTDVPGVYTRISSFVDWIESVTKINTDPRRCALKYTKYREFEPDVILSKGETMEYIDHSKFHVDTSPKDIDFIVDIEECTGILLTEKFVLALASCLNSQSKTPDQLKTRGGTKIKIKTVTLHSRFTSGSIDNDIALIELVSEVKFTEKIRPACLYPKPHIIQEHELGLIGWGAKQNLRVPYFTEDPIYDENEPRGLVKSRLKPVNYTYCNTFYEPEGLLIDEESKICYGNTDYYLVPDTCRLAPGAPIERELYAGERYYSYIMGLPTLANDCGFGFPVIAARVSYYIDWIDSAIFPGEAKDDGGPTSNISTSYNTENCPTLYRQFRRVITNKYEVTNGDEFAHLGLIGYGKTTEWHCRGNLISDKHVLTSNECVNRDSNYDTVALGNFNNFLYGIGKVAYNDRSLTLITLDNVVSFSKYIIPICLWTHKTKIPFESLFIVSKVNSPLTSSSIRPYQTSSCRKMKISSSITSDDQSCLKFFDFFRNNPICTSSGTGVHYIKNETGLIIPYLVGQLDDVARVHCDSNDEDAEYAFTRIAPHIDWILTNMG